MRREILRVARGFRAMAERVSDAHELIPEMTATQQRAARRVLCLEELKRNRWFCIWRLFGRSDAGRGREPLH